MQLRVYHSAFLNVRGRLAWALLQLGEQEAPGPEGGVFCPRLTQAEIAHLLIGATRESVNRWLRWFEHAGAIRRSGGRVALVNVERLRREVY
ncbi:MAG: helix-turn-helix domain-containing protein [Armatimonadetes bacterium]|nr:helix-turn-helix domain-containing protein [Armatimonadota bacterium]MDW8154769.1 helix-turn-helix domain-containing protein [Armatimonadota bacterium]